MEHVALSPDGSKLALVKTQNEDRLLVVASIVTGKVLTTNKVGSAKLRGIEWADNDHLLLTTSTTDQPVGFRGPQQEFSELQIHDVNRNRFTVVLQGLSNVKTLNVIMGTPWIRRDAKGTYLLVPGVYLDSHAEVGLFRVEMNGNASLTEPNDDEQIGDWVIDGDGRIIAAEKYLNKDRRWSILFRKDRLYTEAVAGVGAIEYPGIAGIAPDGKSLWIHLQEEAGGEYLWKPLSLQDGSWGQPLPETRDALALMKDRYTGRITGTVSFDDQYHYHFFDAARQQAWNTVANLFGGRPLRLVSHSDDYRHLVALVGDPDSGPTYMLIDLDMGTALKLGTAYNGLSGLGEVRSITYPAADGLSIQAFLTLPKARSAKDLPLIVLPHGGPQAHEDGSFDWWSQALAAQGYAVLQPNFRGSDNSWKLLSAGFGQWGRKMQTDLSDGVRYLAAQGMIDPKRVCIVGASYGGYAALAGVTLDPGVYRCAAADAGISDLRKLLESEAYKMNETDSQTTRYLDRFLGVTGPRDPTLDALSPIKHIDAVTVPVLLIHGKDDTVVPFEQSQIMLDALQRAGKPVSLVTLKQEDHWLSRSATRLQMLQAVVAFLKTNNPAD